MLPEKDPDFLQIASSLGAQLGYFPAKARPGACLHAGKWHVIRDAHILSGGKAALFLASGENGRIFCAVALREKFLPEMFSGKKVPLAHGNAALICPCDKNNAAALRRLLPSCAPETPAKGQCVKLLTDLTEKTEFFPVFLAPEENFSAVLAEAAFAAFAHGIAAPFAVGGMARDAAAAAKLLRDGATWVELTPISAAAEIAPEEYVGRVFRLEKCALTISEKDFSVAREMLGAALKEAVPTAETTAKFAAAWGMDFPVRLPAAAHLILARELRKKAATPRVLRFAPEREKTFCHAEIAACYGKYELKTVSE